MTHPGHEVDPAPRVTVVHAGNRDGYQVPLAFSEADRLSHLVTDLYFGNLAASLVPRLARYHHGGIPSARVASDLLGGLMMRVRRRLYRAREHELDFENDRRLGRRAARRAQADRATLLAYSYYAFGAFEEAERIGYTGRKVVFQLHPCRGAIAEELGRDRASTGLPFRPEREELPETAASDEARYLSHSDLVICTSRFTASGLGRHAGYAGPIELVPYGTRSPLMGAVRRTGDAAGRRPLRLLTVAQMSQRKGLHYLFDALSAIPAGRIEHRLVAQGWRDPVLLPMVPDCTTLIDGLDARALGQQFAWADAFVLPSLAEGFGLVFTEALAAGLPVIGTDRTCLPDVITDGREGFIVPAGESTPLRLLLTRLAEDRGVLGPMSASALETADRLTWERFRSRLVEIV